jgi:hypothetical protein
MIDLVCAWAGRGACGVCWGDRGPGLGHVQHVVSPTWLARSTHAYVDVEFPSKSAGEKDEGIDQ